LLAANERAAATLPNPQALNANALRVGLPFSSFIGPFMPANLAAKLTRLGFLPDLTGAFRLDPSVLLK
jgi:hypothetical protein